MKSASIKVGDKFTKAEDPETVWVVNRLVDPPGVPPHAELKAHGFLNRMMMLSQEALTDHRLYQRIEND